MTITLQNRPLEKWSFVEGQYLQSIDWGTKDLDGKKVLKKPRWTWSSDLTKESNYIIYEEISQRWIVYQMKNSQSKILFKSEKTTVGCPIDVPTDSWMYLVSGMFIKADVDDIVFQCCK